MRRKVERVAEGAHKDEKKSMKNTKQEKVRIRGREKKRER